MKAFLILIAVMLTVFIIVGNFIVWFSDTYENQSENNQKTTRSTVGNLTLIVIYIWVTILTFGGYW